MDVAWVGGVEGPKDEEDFSCSVAGRVEEACSSHFERVFETRLSARFLLSEFLERRDVIIGVSAHVGNANREAIAHTDYTELRDWVLFKEFRDEAAGVTDGEMVASGPEVLLLHCDGKVED